MTVEVNVSSPYHISRAGMQHVAMFAYQIVHGAMNVLELEELPTFEHRHDTKDIDCRMSDVNEQIAMRRTSVFPCDFSSFR
jgi:hypothetical protein